MERGDLPVIGFGQLAASAGNFSHIGISTPINSNISLTIEAIGITNTGAAATVYNINLTSGITQDTSAQTSSRDLRTPRQGASQILTRNQGTQFGTFVAQVSAPANSSVVLSVPPRGLFTLSQIQTGTGPVSNSVSVVPSTNNTGLNVWFLGYEKILEPPEVAG